MQYKDQDFHEGKDDLDGKSRTLLAFTISCLDVHLINFSSTLVAHDTCVAFRAFGINSSTIYCKHRIYYRQEFFCGHR
jgi:hypothetical protein